MQISKNKFKSAIRITYQSYILLDLFMLTLQLLIKFRVFKLLLALWASNKYLAGPKGQLKILSSQRLYMICCGQRPQHLELS